MSELIINLETATPAVLRAAVRMCEALLHNDEVVSQVTHAVPGQIVNATEVAIRIAEDSKIRGAAHTHVWTDEAQHIQQEHIDSLNGAVATITPGLPPEFALVTQPPVVTPPGFVAGGVTNGLPAEFTPGTAVTPLELDSAGLPWDARIHSTNKTKLANGTWRPKKGVDAAVQKQVVTQIANEVTHIPPAAITEGGLTWQPMLQRIVAATQSKQLNVIEFNQWLVDRGVQGGVAMLSLRNDLWNDVITTFKV